MSKAFFVAEFHRWSPLWQHTEIKQLKKLHRFSYTDCSEMDMGLSCSEFTNACGMLILIGVVTRALALLLFHLNPSMIYKRLFYDPVKHFMH